MTQESEKTKSNYMKKKISYCLKCGKKTKKMKTGVELENKIGQQKSMCLVCDSKKSTFLKPITNKKQKHANLLFRV